MKEKIGTFSREDQEIAELEKKLGYGASSKQFKEDMMKDGMLELYFEDELNLD